MFRQSLRLALAATALAGSFAIASPAQAAPAVDSHATVSQGAPSTGERPHRRHHRFHGRRFDFGFPVVTPFLGGSGFGFDGGFGRSDCDIFLAIGDINSYILCRVG